MTNYLKVFYLVVESKKEMECQNCLLWKHVYILNTLYFRDILQIIQPKSHSILNPAIFFGTALKNILKKLGTVIVVRIPESLLGLRKNFIVLFTDKRNTNMFFSKEEWLLQVPIKVANSTFKNLVCAVVDDNFCKCVSNENTSLHTDTNISISCTHALVHHRLLFLVVSLDKIYFSQFSSKFPYQFSSLSFLHPWENAPKWN